MLPAKESLAAHAHICGECRCIAPDIAMPACFRRGFGPAVR